MTAAAPLPSHTVAADILFGSVAGASRLESSEVDDGGSRRKTRSRGEVIADGWGACSLRQRAVGKR